MFEVGKTYKVKVESEPGNIGFGRATIVERSGSQVRIQLKTSKNSNLVLPRGTKIWFVHEAAETNFSGLWSSTIVESEPGAPRATMLCSAPRLDPVASQRRAPRVTVDVPVKMTAKDGSAIGSEIRSRDISRSGIGLETTSPFPDSLDEEVNIIIESNVGDINATCRVIRTDKNWLASKTSIGLEYINLPPESVTSLDKLLILLGGRPRHEQAQEESSAARGRAQKGLSEWMSASRTNMPALTGKPPDKSAEAEESKSPGKQTGLAGWASASYSNLPAMTSNKFVGGDQDAGEAKDKVEPKESSPDESDA